MKNLKMALKIGLGFCLVVGIMLVLSLMAINAMKKAEENASAISNTYMPELVIGVHIDRATSDALASMLRYTAREDARYVNDVGKHLDTIRAELDAADKLLAQYPHLAKLEENLAKFRPVIAAYSQQVDKTVELVENIKKQRQNLAAAAESYMSSTFSMLNDQNARLDAAITNAAPVQEVTRRLEQTRLLNTLLDLGAAVRLSNFQSQALNDPKIAEEGLKSFRDITATLDRLGRRNLFQGLPSAH